MTRSDFNNLVQVSESVNNAAQAVAICNKLRGQLLQYGFTYTVGSSHNKYIDTETTWYRFKKSYHYLDIDNDKQRELNISISASTQVISGYYIGDLNPLSIYPISSESPNDTLEQWNQYYIDLLSEVYDSTIKVVEYMEKKEQEYIRQLSVNQASDLDDLQGLIDI